MLAEDSDSATELLRVGWLCGGGIELVVDCCDEAYRCRCIAKRLRGVGELGESIRFIAGSGGRDCGVGGVTKFSWRDGSQSGVCLPAGVIRRSEEGGGVRGIKFSSSTTGTSVIQSITSPSGLRWAVCEE